MTTHVHKIYLDNCVQSHGLNSYVIVHETRSLLVLSVVLDIFGTNRDAALQPRQGASGPVYAIGDAFIAVDL
jgi:hypothetical protein